MADGSRGAHPATDRVRDIEMRLFEEVGTQLKGLAEAMKDLTHEMRDVRERLIRIDAQDQPKKIAALEDAAHEAASEIARVEREAEAEIARIEQDAAAKIAAAVAAVTATAAAEKLALERRLIRMETIIAPLTVGGSAFLAAVIGAIVTFGLNHVH
jgi:biopolymer transport protein ExbB/TolQ